MNMCHSHYATLNDVSSASTQVRLFHLPGLICYLPGPSTDLELYLQVVSYFLFTVLPHVLHPSLFRLDSTAHRNQPTGSRSTDLQSLASILLTGMCA